VIGKCAPETGSCTWKIELTPPSVIIGSLPNGLCRVIIAPYKNETIFIIDNFHVVLTCTLYRAVPYVLKRINNLSVIISAVTEYTFGALNTVNLFRSQEL
jgi:hypothetical protein